MCHCEDLNFCYKPEYTAKEQGDKNCLPRVLCDCLSMNIVSLSRNWGTVGETAILNDGGLGQDGEEDAVSLIPLDLSIPSRGSREVGEIYRNVERLMRPLPEVR